MLCREYKVNHEEAKHDPEETKGNVQNWSLGSKWNLFKPQLCHLLAMSFLKQYKTSLLLNFIISKTGTVIPTSQITFTD